MNLLHWNQWGGRMLPLRSLLVVMCMLMLSACGGGGSEAPGTGTGTNPPGTGTNPPGTGTDPGGSVVPSTVAIAAQPSDLSVQEGAAATFSVSADHADSYQWQRQTNGAWVDIGSARGRSLTLPETSLADHGAQFRVQVTGASITVTSSAATLSVVAQAKPAQITAAPTSINRFVGESASFSVTATGTALAYRWQRSANGTTWNDIAGATLATLNLSNLTLGDNGTHVRVIVSSSINSVTSAVVVLGVELPPLAPSFTTQPADVNVEAGQSATFTIVAVGQPAPSVRWQQSRNGGWIWSDIDGATQASYTLTESALADDGLMVRVIAANASGTSTSSTAKLQVRVKPVVPFVTTQPLDVSVNLASAASFTVAFAGSPTPTVQWQHCLGDGCSWANISGATSGTYALGATTLSDNGRQFRAVLTNSAGTTTTRAARLTVTLTTSLKLLSGTPDTDGHKDGPLLSARFSYPNLFVNDSAGNLIVADSGSHVIRKVDFRRGQVSTIAGQPFESGVEDGDISTARLNLSGRMSLGVDAAGNVYISDHGGARLRKLSRDGLLKTLPISGASIPHGLGMATSDAAGNVYVGGWGVIYKIDPAGLVTTLAGAYGQFGVQDGVGANARFQSTHRLAMANGELVVGETDRLRKITLGGEVTTVMGVPSDSTESRRLFEAQAVDGRFYTPGTTGGIRLGDTLIAGQPYVSGRREEDTIYGLGVDKAGVIHTFSGDVMYRTERNGTRTRLPISSAAVSGSRTTFAGVAFSGTEMLTCELAGSSVLTSYVEWPTLWASDGSGGKRKLATGVGCPWIAAGKGGHIVVAESEAVSTVSPSGAGNNLVHRITPGGAQAVSLLLRWVRGVAVDVQGNIYTTHNTHIKKTTPSGVISVFAGDEQQTGHADGYSNTARFTTASGIAIDAADTLYVYDNYLIRRIAPDGRVTTVLGKPGQAGLETGGDPRLGSIWGRLAIGGNDELIIADWYTVLSATIPGIRCDCGPRALHSNAERLRR